METKRRGRPRKNPVPAPSPASTPPSQETGAEQPSLFSAGELPDPAPPRPAPPRLPSDLVSETVPIIEVTAQLVDALERGDPQARVYVEQLLRRYVELYGEAGAANFQRAFDGVARAKRQRLPDHIPQQTSQEVRSLAVAISDGRTFTRWEEVLGEVALRHVIADEPFQVKFAPGPALMAHLGGGQDLEALRKEIERCDLDAVLLFYETLGSLVLQQESAGSSYFTTSLDDLIDALGWNKAARQSSEARGLLRERIYHWLMVFDGMKVIGMRPGHYRDPDSRKQLELMSEDALIRIVGQKVSTEVRDSEGRPMPLEVTFAAGPWIEQFRGNRQILAEFGNVRAIARIPGGKPSGAWARCIAMTLYQRWREGASRTGSGDEGENTAGSKSAAPAKSVVRWRPFTRRQLLRGLFKAEPDVLGLLEGANPIRALEYWREAIQVLKDEGIVSQVRAVTPLEWLKEDAISIRRPAQWRDQWIDQPLDFTPGEAELEAAREIRERAAQVQAAFSAKRKRGRPRKSTP